jgi:hypothetical protein
MVWEFPAGWSTGVANLVWLEELVARVKKFLQETGRFLRVFRV